MNTKKENQASEKVQQNAKARAAVHEKKRTASAAERAPKTLTASQRRDRFGKLNGVGVVPVVGENGVSRGFAIGMLVSKISAAGRERRAMVTLQECLEGASIFASDFNKWTKRVYQTRTAAIVAASAFAKYTGLALLPSEAADLVKAEKAEKAAADKAKADREAAKAERAKAEKEKADQAAKDSAVNWKERAERAERALSEAHEKYIASEEAKAEALAKVATLERSRMSDLAAARAEYENSYGLRLTAAENRAASLKAEAQKARAEAKAERAAARKAAAEVKRLAARLAKYEKAKKRK